MTSPVRTSASGPPTADSGATCRITVPYEVPLIRASEMRTMSFTPALSKRAGIGAAPHSGMPGAPLGPAFCSTSTEFSSIGIAGSSMRSRHLFVIVEDHRAPAVVEQVLGGG